MKKKLNVNIVKVKPFLKTILKVATITGC